MHNVDRCLFSLTNSTLSLKWMRFSLIDPSAEAGAPRMAIVSNSILSISESVLELSPSTSPILISSSTINESTDESSIVVNNCSVSSQSGQLRGVVETSAFPSFEGPVSVSIVGCSFDSQRIVGKDGIGLSLTPTPRPSEQVIRTISSSLIDCSFLNMTSIGSSHQPRLPHLSQKMLGCVVSLTSSHLSGSTIRDLNNGGSVLCSNSSFSSLLSSSDTNPSRGTVTISDGSPEDFVDGKLYDSLGTSAIFSNCHFTQVIYDPDFDMFWSPIYIWSSPDSISILSCSFTNLYCTDPDDGSDVYYGAGGAVRVTNRYCLDFVSVIVTSSNFTNCSAPNFGGALDIRVNGEVVVDSCRFENCSSTNENWRLGRGGGIYLSGFLEYFLYDPLQFALVGCVFADCSALQGGGVMVEMGDVDVFVVDTKFERCAAVCQSGYSKGGGMAVDTNEAFTVERCQFIGCSSHLIGGAFFCDTNNIVNISDTLVQGCFSGTAGAIYALSSMIEYLSLSHVVFDGNRIGADTSSFSNDITDGSDKHRPIDLSIDFAKAFIVGTEFTFDDCFTTVSPFSAGVVDLEGFKAYYIYMDGYAGIYRFLDYVHIGPYLTDSATARMNEKTGLIELELKAKTPLISQEYEVTVKDSTKTETTFRVLFVNGTGTLVSPSEAALKYGSTYEITSIVGVVPASTSSAMSNDNSMPVLPYAFSFYEEGIFQHVLRHVFDTPSVPSFSTLQVATAHLIESDPQSAFVVLVFDKEVWGWYEFVVEEEGEDVILAINTETSSKSGATKEFKVIGVEKLLTHDTTYTIKSIVRDPESESPFVRMNETISFHIPKSPYVPPEEPTEPEPEDPKDKKAMSPEMKSLLSWLVPLVACLLITLVVLVVVLVLVYRRKKNTEPAQKEMEVQEPFDVEKVEEFGVDCSNGVIHMDGMSHSAFDTSSDQKPTLKPSRDEGKAETEGEWVEVMACCGGFEISVVPMGYTLYSVLHKEHREVGKRGVGMQIVNGQRQSGTGIGPKMESLQNEDFISLISRCVSVDPEQRPTLTEVGEFLSSHPDETIRASRNELKE
ncbi:hypothetical protein BLNAU_23427 [Blattamonas nauphoetae]|uniref:Uncharacterized protein n=1 Tax=Blattamonas nauphoetae TaxID=2049346 RepID=A0ABQ9WQA3_9EUKA|nr:hypothetical protein BLNAU_23427 [Blattamonas nauphoetae]